MLRLVGRQHQCATHHVLCLLLFSSLARDRAVRFASNVAAAPATVQQNRISKVLIANRGEIAVRVMKTAKRLGVQTVAVFSDADRHSMHVAQADEAYHIGAAAPASSYLVQDKIIAVAHQSGAQAIHPGYGFLSENASFADLCEREKLIFVGPPSSAIRSMGSKSVSKEIMHASNVPIVPGYYGADQDAARLEREAAAIGYPVLIKAVMGGGGKGMRIVKDPKDFQEALKSARREAVNSFGDDNVLVERYIERSRHVEVQVFADSHGNAVYLFERDCSVQRRHQKVIEEAPAPHLSPALRKDLGEAAVRAALAVNYRGAGTVEFIMDMADNKFYFMEMNTRLQVEHPVTEMITGTDLVEWQLKVAAGARLPLLQNQLAIKGHAFEARIYAEDPYSNFVPGTGKLKYLSPPAVSPVLRVESGVRQGDEVSPYYDPMIAKLVVWGEDRQQALDALTRGLRQYDVAGLKTNIDFLVDLASHPEFAAGNVSTKFINDHGKDLLHEHAPQNTDILQAVAAFVLAEKSGVSPASGDVHSPWNARTGARLGPADARTIVFTAHKTTHTATVTTVGAHVLRIAIGGQAPVDVEAHLAGEQLTCIIGGHLLRSRAVLDDHTLFTFSDAGHFDFEFDLPAFLAETGAAAGTGAVKAPMTGTVKEVLVKEGESVVKDQPVVVMVAMKMEYILRATVPGVVRAVNATTEALVQQDAVLVVVEDPADAKVAAAAK